MKGPFPAGQWGLGRVVIVGIAAVVGALAEGEASAGGIGGSLSFDHGVSDLSDRDDFWYDLEAETDGVGVGFIFDSNLAQDRLFNYRLNTSIAFLDQEVSQGGFEDQVQGTRLSLDQTLGFGFIRTPDVRVFVGPSLHLGVGVIDDEIDDGVTRVDYEATSFTAGIGPELGVNFHVGRHLTFSTSAYLRYGLQVQSFDRPYDDLGSDGDFFGDELRGGIVTSIFFRFGPDAGY